MIISNAILKDNLKQYSNINNKISREIREGKLYKIVTGLYYDGRIINDYTSLIVRKRVREGNVGYAALIEYGMDTPMFATEEKEEQQEAAEYIKNMDISSLL